MHFVLFRRFLFIYLPVTRRKSMFRVQRRIGNQKVAENFVLVLVQVPEDKDLFLKLFKNNPLMTIDR